MEKHSNFQSVAKINKVHYADKDSEIAAISVALTFYDGVINSNHLINLSREGWIPYFKDLANYQKIINTNTINISVNGHFNKGKTFLLGKISGTNLPDSFNINTLGISFKIINNDNNDPNSTAILAIDCSGSSMPVNTIENYQDLIKDDETFQKLKETTDFGKPYVDSQFKCILADHFAMEELIQTFSLTFSNFAIVVVADLTFEDQKLIKKIELKFCNNKSKGNNCQLLVIHNLYHCETRDDVERKIESTITKSFNLTEKFFAFDSNNQNHLYFEEHLSDGSKRYHLIYAKEGSEAGNYYNGNSLRFIRSRIQTCNPKKKDIVKEFYNYLQATLPMYIMDVEHKNWSFDEKNYVIKLDKIEWSDFKNLSADELGMIKNSYPYSVLVDEVNKLFILKIEIPGEVESLTVLKELNGDDFRLKLTAKKVLEADKGFKKLHDIRKGDFIMFCTPYFNDDEYSLIEESQKYRINGGYHVITWNYEKFEQSP